MTESTPGASARWWGLALLAFLLCSTPAAAHPLSISYVDLRLDRAGLEASVEAQAVDLAHELTGLTVSALLTPGSLQAHRREVAALLTSRLALSASGRPLPASMEGIAPIPNQKSVRLRLRYAWQQPPATLQIRCALFPYHPRHQTLVDIYEGQALRREMIFDAGTTEQDYVPGSRQSVALVVRQFLAQGVYHIFTGPDHILFILGLLLLGGSLKQLLKIVTAFTLAHSVTLSLATLNILTPPGRIVEPAIALSIVLVGVNGVANRKNLRMASPPDARLAFAFGFGLIHGFGFANALQELELPRQALVAALASFNVGVECGQACIILMAAPLLSWLHRANEPLAARLVTAGSLAVIGAVAFWFVQRVLAV